MALGFGSKAEKADDSSNDNGKTGDELFNKDAETGGLEKQRRGSRLEGPARPDMDSSDEQSISVGKQIELEAGNAIQYRTCSWQKTAALLFSEYICLAIMSFPWSYSILGLVPGLILTVVIAALVLYTSLICW